MTNQTTQIIFACTALVCAAVGAACDLKTRRIPNLLTGSSILGGLTLHLVLGGWGQLGMAAAAAGIGGGVFLVFYMAGGMGAGDVKLMAAVSCLAGYHSVAELLVSTAIMGGVFAIALALVHGQLKQTFKNIFALFLHHRSAGLSPHPELNVTNHRTLRLPYAVAIAAGCLITFYGQMPPR